MHDEDRLEKFCLCFVGQSGYLLDQRLLHTQNKYNKGQIVNLCLKFPEIRAS